MVLNARARRGMGWLLALAAAGCGFNLGDVDRTQPDKVKKSIFTDGAPWYFRQTIIDIPATSDISFVGEQGATHKIVWKVDEQFLYAYRAYEQLKGGEEYAQRPGVPYLGTPTAAFAITSHFDVQREYNAQTGEQTNVISENTNDRPWYERQYMRVDWSKNLISDLAFKGSSVAQQPVGRYVREGEADKDAARIGDSYVDIVHDITAEPETNAYLTAHYGFPVPTCWLYKSIYADCMGGRIKVRSSFLKANSDNAYEPLTYDDHKFAKFGFFRIDRYGYDRRYGVVDTKVDYLVERFNLWKQRPGETSCKDDSKAHPWEGCSNDKINPIVYYVNEDMPAALKGDNLRIGAEWNRVFKNVVAEMTGRPVASLPNVVVMCANNPVQAGDPAECGAAGLNPLIGDLRYSFVYYVRSQQNASPLGYGPHAPDPITGEVISANAFIYGAALEKYTQYVLDFIKLQNGDLSVNDLYNGQNIVQHYQRMMANRADREHFAEPRDWARAADKLGIKEKAAGIRDQVNRNMLSTDLTPGRLAKMRGSQWEAVFFNEDMRRALTPQFENANDVPEEYRNFLSPVTLSDPTFARLGREREFKLSSSLVEPTEFFEDDGMQGLARRLNCAWGFDGTGAFQPPEGVEDPVVDRARFCTGNKVNEAVAYQYLLDEIYIGVTLHEVGHNMGLRHNFAATTDAINYFDKYWDLRGPTRNAADQFIKPEFNMTSSAERARLKDAVDQGMREYQYSSIMDYGAKPNSDLQGLGRYDQAAILYGYGQMVEVFDNTQAKIDRNHADLLLPVARHYTAYPDLIANDPSYTFEDKVSAMRARKVMTEAMLQASQDVVEVPYRFCSDEYVNGVYYCYRFDQGADAYEQVKANSAMYENYYVFNGMRRNRVGFGMDVWGYLGRIYGRYFSFLSAQNKHFLNDNLVNRFWDSGCSQPGAEGIHFTDPACGLDRFAGALEAAATLGRVLQTPEPGCYVRRKPGCYEDSQQDVNGIPVSIQRQDAAYCQNPPAQSNPTLVTATDAYTLISNSLDCTAWRPLLTAGGDEIWEKPLEVKLGEGRFGLDKYNRDAYGYGFYWKPVVIGAWWDKWLAMQAMGDPYTDFIGVDARGDTRSYLISFNSLFRNDIATAVGSFITEDYSKYGPYVTFGATGEPKVFFPDTVVPFASALVGSASRVPPGAIALNPDEKYTTRLQALYIATMYYSQITDDQDFNQAAFIGKAGTTLDLSVPPEVKADPNRYAELTDPVTGAVYFGVKNQPDKSWFLSENPFYSAGYEYVKKTRDAFMTSDGKHMLPGKSVGSVRSDIRFFEIMRGFLSHYNYGDGSGASYNGD